MTDIIKEALQATTDVLIPYIASLEAALVEKTAKIAELEKGGKPVAWLHNTSVGSYCTPLQSESNDAVPLYLHPFLTATKIAEMEKILRQILAADQTENDYDYYRALNAAATLLGESNG